VTRPGGSFNAQLSRRIRTLALAQRVDTNQLRRRFVFERFLARVFAEPDSTWVLKGAAGLLNRLPTARYSQDIDLYRDGTLGVALADLRRAAGTNIDDFRFDIAHERPLHGPVNGATVTVTARIGAQTFETFPIDVSTQLLPVDPDFVQPRPVFADLGLPLSMLRIYPVPNHVADKVCAMYQSYSGRPSSRYRDLVDLVLIVDQQPIDQEQTVAALRAEAQRRAMDLPEAMAVPGPDWPGGYFNEARR